MIVQLNTCYQILIFFCRNLKTAFEVDIPATNFHVHVSVFLVNVALTFEFEVSYFLEYYSHIE